MLIIMAGAFLSSCGQGAPSGSPGTTAVPGNQSGSPDAAKPTGPPRITCEPFLPSTPCGEYISIGASSDGGTVPWAAAGGVSVQLQSVEGERLFIAKTPCAPINGSAKIAGDTLTVGALTFGAVGCSEVTGPQQQWVETFLKRPIRMSFSQGELTWKSGPDTLIFRSK